MDERLNYAPGGYLSLADDGEILNLNHTLLLLLGYKLHELQGQHINRILSAPGRLFYQVYFFPLITLNKKVEEMYVSLKTKTGQTVPFMINAVRREYGGVPSNECMLTPMKQRYKYEQGLLAAKKAAEEATRTKNEAIADLEKLRKDLEAKQAQLLLLNTQLKLLATTDELTGLSNRRSFHENLRIYLERFHQLKQPLSLLLLDVDYFKSINDTFGHVMGDSVLQHLAQTLLQECRKTDIAARYGGEEFALILPNTEAGEALVVAERIRTAVAQGQGLSIPITISIGAATMAPGDNEDTILTKADRALYASKNGGRNLVTHASSLISSI